MLAFCKYISDDKHPRGERLRGTRININKLELNKIYVGNKKKVSENQKFGKVSNTKGGESLINFGVWLVYEIGCVT